ncbi:MAG: iron complex outermembrane receptor protein [Crocinitomicaceae bacterium]|jgi:iron complex outermembrane receptor protein
MQRSMQFIVLLIVTLSVSPLMAQDSCSYQLSGYVIDEHDRSPLANSKVYIKEPRRGVFADSSGYFVFPGLCSGTYEFYCKHVGCDAVKKTITIQGNTEQNFYPEHHIDFDAVNVIAKKTSEELSLGTRKLSEKDKNETKGLSLGDGLTRINGVRKLSTGNNISKPVIHGLHSNRILILNNGVRQEGQQWGNEHAPEIDPFIADELAVVKGANGVRYGPDAIGGVVLVNPKELRKTPGIGGELNLVGLSNGLQGNASATLDGNLSKFPAISWRLQGTVKRGGNVKSPDYYLKNTGSKEYNFSGALGYKKPKYGIDLFYSQFNTDIGIFSAAHIGNLTDLQQAFEAEEPLETAGFTYDIDRPRQHIEHELFKTKGYLRTGKKGEIALTYARQYNKRLEYDKHAPLNDSLANLNLPALQFELTTHTAEIVWEHIRMKSFKGSVGVNGTYQENTYEGRFFIPNFQKIGGGVFWIESWKPKASKLEIESGVRFDNIYQRVYMWKDGAIVSPAQNYMNMSGTIGAIYKVNKRLILRSNLGTAWRPPNINELYSNGLHHGAASIEIGDSTLVTEKAVNVSASVEYSGKRLSVVLDAYYNVINDFIYLKPTLVPTVTIKGAFPTFVHDQVDAHLRGLDFTLSYALTEELKVVSKASILRAFNQTTRQYLVMMPADRFENSLEYNFKDGKKVENAYVSLSVTSVLKQSRVPENSDYVDPPEGYTVLNFAAGIDIPLKRNSISLGISANNLLNVRYRDYMNRFRYFADEMGRNVSVRATIPFTLFTPKSIHNE